MLLQDAPGIRHDAVLVIQPNRNLSWNTTKLAFLFLAMCIVAVACYFVALGAWLVVPFAGIELLLIGLCMYLQCCHAHRQQIIQVDASSVSISDGREKAPLACFPRAWLKVM